jgi:antitoxin component YwqK of YwqJK toxin-antitoxin module
VKWFTGNLGTTNTIFSTTTLLNQQYYHVVGTYDGASKKLYINGNLEASASISNGINNTSTLGSIGYVQYLNAQYFNGRIASTRVYSRALTSQEILQNYNSQKSRFGLT